MGLDTVELVIEVEERFGIAISDEDAAEILTVGQLNDLIRSRIRARQLSLCPSLPAFLQVRRVTRDILNAPGLRLRPSTQITDLIPRSLRRAWLKRMHTELGIRLPELRRPPALRYAILAMAVIPLAAVLPLAVKDLGAAPALLFVAAFVAIAVAVVANTVTAPLCFCIPSEMTTLGDVTRRVTGLSVATATDVSEDKVEETTRAIIVEQLGVDPDEVVPEARFVNDLGCD